MATAAAAAEPEIVALARQILDNTIRVSSFLQDANLPQPSFDKDAPLQSQVPPATHPDVEAARVAVIDATQRLRRLMLGPRDYLMDFRHNAILPLHAASRFNFASHVPLHSSASYADVASASGLRERDATRLLRHAVARDVFTETSDGRISHNAVSRLLREDKPAAEWLAFMAEDMWGASVKTVDALQQFGLAGEEPHPGRTGFALAHETDLPLYEYFARHPERAERFARTMTNLAGTPGYHPRHLADGFDWAALPDGARVVDVGGSDGGIATYLSARFSHLDFVVQDREEIVREAASAQSKTAQGTNSRLTYMVHDFFDAQPIIGVDVFLLRWILHNWPDEYCVKILRLLGSSLKAGGRVIVNESILPPPGVKMPALVGEKLRSADLQMLSLFNSQERQLDGWRALFEQADRRFHFIGARQPEGSRMAVMEVVWKP